MSDGHIILVGFMGSGKTTVAHHLSRLLDLPCIDADAGIEQAAGMSIPDIFSAEGEGGFRGRETAFLKSMLDHERCILSCGGGVVGSTANRVLLKQLGRVIYLEVSIDEALSRVASCDNRPMLTGAKPPVDLFCEREALYDEVADITVDTNGLSPWQVAHETCRRLGYEA
ncbi:MAG: shikimate kinase [Coriobacteriales bacterium]|jgi:shikimate kinase|nr:shikimate kinase [Coriobacteriales bacterium]